MSRSSKQRVHVITMGCAKNVVDSEKLMAQLRGNDFELAPTIEDADVAVINTCGFIDAAKRESIDEILEQVGRKKDGGLRKVYAIGCLTERFRTTLAEEIPEVDGYFGSGASVQLVEELGGRVRQELLGERVLSTSSHIAYLKVSEGCDHPCAFCAIPLMRGRLLSRPMEEILRETEMLAARGVREVVVIAQDTTAYGLDLYGSRKLSQLVRKIADVSGIAWVRLMYTYPAQFPLDLLEVIAGHPRVCKYLDIPVQHVSEAVLRSMRRGISRRALLSLIERIRSAVPGIALRSTLIVGYPTEGSKEFNELLAFIKVVRFDRLGVFTYSREEGTTAHSLGDPVSMREKERRLAMVMETQQEISTERNEGLVGSKIQVMVDRVEGDQYVGRTEHDAPEIDNEVYLTADSALVPGQFCEATITGASEYDLYGRA
ncbi:MAG: 30S ribosomal protein S12 methylthiotransferase RimO [Bacteroidota bacterium]